MYGESMPASKNYLGHLGEIYFTQQSKGGLRKGELESRKFKKLISPASSILDFGCGDGSLIFHLPCKTRAGVEINPVARKAAEELGIVTYSNVSLVPDSSFDIIISNHALEHVECPYRELEQLFNKLLPNGRLIIFVPLDDWRVQKKLDPNDKRHHLYTWTPQLLHNLLTEVGFIVNDIWILTSVWPSKWQFFDRCFPIWLFDIICFLNAVFRKRRQIGLIALKPDLN